MEDRVPTGIQGFDRLVGGGFPRGTVNLLSGPAGSGKSLFGLHFAYNGAALFGENSMVVVLEETRRSLERAMASYGMEVGPYEREGRFLLVDIGELRTDEPERVVGFDEIRGFLDAALPRSGARRLVLDSLSAIGLYYGSAEQLRERMFSFTRFLRARDVTTLLITESEEGAGLTRFGLEQFLADSFIYLGLEEIKGDLRRTLTVRKMRFTRHDAAKHPVHVTSAGLVVLDQEKVM